MRKISVLPLGMGIEKGKVKQLTPLQRHQRKFSASLSLQKAVGHGQAWSQGPIPRTVDQKHQLHSLIPWQSLFLTPSQNPCLLEAKLLPRTVPSTPCPCLSKDRPGARSLPPTLGFCNQSPLGLLRSHTSSWGCPRSSLKKNCISWQSSYLQSPLSFWLRLIHSRRSLK